MIELIKTGTISYVSYKAMKIFNKDYADILGFCGILYVGIGICLKVGGWYNAFMGSDFIQLMIRIFG